MAQNAKKPRIKIELTAEQQEQVRKATGRTVAAVELAPETLEARIAPASFLQPPGGGGGGAGGADN